MLDGPEGATELSMLCLQKTVRGSTQARRYTDSDAPSSESAKVSRLAAAVESSKVTAVRYGGPQL